MKHQKVNMVVRFVVPVGREYYGDRNTVAPWENYAEHDMGQYIKDIEDVPVEYQSISCAGNSIEWLEEFDSER